MNWYDKFFCFFGRLAFVGAIIYLLYRFVFKPNFIILHLDLAKQLGI